MTAKRLLIMDDEPDFCDFVATVGEGLGYQATKVTDPRKFKTVYAEIQPDCVVIDMVMPELDGKLDGYAVRVPTINVSLVDLTFRAARDTSIEEINDVIKTASDGVLAGVLAYNDEPLVSIDFNHNPASSIFESSQTKVIEALCENHPLGKTALKSG